MPATHLRARYTVARGQIVSAPPSAFDQDFLFTPYQTPGFTLQGSVAVVDVCGPLFQKPDLFGISNTYSCILGQIEAALASPASMVVLKLDSPGGDFPGNLESVGAIRAMADAAGKPLIAYTETQALSAAYALACACDQIVITPSAFVGSVGVWCQLVDITAADKAQGANIVIVASGPKKAERNPHNPITDAAVANMQVQVDAMAAMFFEVVASRRGMSLEAVEALGGGQEFGIAAVKAGLANRVVSSWAEFLATAKEESMGLYEKALALKKSAEEDGSDEDKAVAKKMLAKMFGEEDDAKSEEEAPESKKEAKAEDEKKEEPKAAAMGTVTLAPHELAARIHALEVENRLAKEQTEKFHLLSTRPDFSAEVRASLTDKSTPLAFVKNAVKTWKRAESPAASAVNAAEAAQGGTQGAPAAKASGGLDSEQAAALAKMGKLPEGDGIKHLQGGTAMTLGAMTADQAAKAWAELQAKGGV